MLIDVVIPTFNRLWALRRVAEFYARRDEVRRVIVVDDGSTDGTAEWLRDAAAALPRLQPLRHERNRGASASRNTGADATGAPFVFFADDDMLPEPACGLLTMVREVEASQAHIASPLHILPEERRVGALPSVLPANGGPPPQIFHRPTLELCSREVLARCALPLSFPTPLACGLMLMRREVLDHVRYDEGLGVTGYRDETDFQLKALARGFRLIACARPVLVDLARANDAGGCHAVSTRAAYEWMAWRNNWRILNRHRAVIRDHLGIKAPLVYLQGRFVASHAVNRLARHYVGRLLRSVGILGGR